MEFIKRLRSSIHKAAPSYIFVSHKNAGRFSAKFSEKKKKVSIFLLPLIGFSGEIITSFPQKTSKKHLGQGMAGSVKDPST